jgi:hypothetical protein
MKRAPKFTGESSKAFVKFLGLVHAAALKGNANDLGAQEIAMLNTLAQGWLDGVPLSVLGAMRANDTCSSTSSHRSLKLLRKKGYISLAVDDLDNRVKAVLPTALAMQYFDVMGKCMQKATT